MATYKRKRVKVGTNSWLNQTITNRGVRTTSMSTSKKTGGTRVTTNRSLHGKSGRSGTIKTTRTSSDGWVTKTSTATKARKSPKAKSSSSRTSRSNKSIFGSTRSRRSTAQQLNPASIFVIGGIAFLLWIASLVENLIISIKQIF